MAFQRLHKPRRNGGSTKPQISIGSSDSNRQAWLSINTPARKALGEPVSVRLEYDPDEYLLRIVGAPLDDPDAYGITKNTGRISVTGIMRELGIDVTTTRTYDVKQDTKFSLIIDIGDTPTAGTA